jgi:3-oxoacyl-[acyl-carrier protein] reductase
MPGTPRRVLVTSASKGIGLAPGSPGEKLYLDRVPQHRFGRPAEIAAGICFLLSDDAAFITGQTLRIDGGGSIGA